MRHHDKHQMTFGEGRYYAAYNVKKKMTTFNVLGKKNSQTPISVAD